MVAVTLTVVYVGEQRGRKTEDDHQHVSHGQIDDEVVGGSAHAWRSVEVGDKGEIVSKEEREEKEMGCKKKSNGEGT